MATLIDNIFISEWLQCNFDSALLLSNISDHLPIVTLMKQMKVVNKRPIEYYNQKLSNEEIKEINNKFKKLTGMET